MTLGLQAQALGGALALAAWASGAAAEPAPAQLNTLKDLGAAMRACWIPPPIEQARPGMQITVMMSFKRYGALLGQPRITFELELFGAAMQDFEAKIEIRLTTAGGKLLPALELGQHKRGSARAGFLSDRQIDLRTACKVEPPSALLRYLRFVRAGQNYGA